jgi:hypothetical protein
LPVTGYFILKVYGMRGQSEEPAEKVKRVLKQDGHNASAAETRDGYRLKKRKDKTRREK